MTFAIGDRIMLKGGGPIMTIVGISRSLPDNETEADRSIHCAWFNIDGDGHKYMYQHIAAGALDKVEPKKD